ncbi:MAG: EAL domain-containing protein [Myxococcota bacterium]|nr:EAL domain-containing protein [Myxococcota bacterium]
MPLDPATSRSMIMMVDDEPTTVDVIEMFLQAEGYERFVAVTDSRDAIETMERESPDVLLLDLMMPYVSGLEILTAMRERPALAQIPVVILTSSTDSDIKLQALELGATDFLAKPVDPSELVLRVRNTLAAKTYRDRLTYYDRLTGLPNRQLLIGRIEAALAKVSPWLALLRIGVDRFRQINDTLGQGQGDALLGALADRIAKSLELEELAGSGANATLARLGGDEFALLLPAADARQAEGLATMLLERLADPFVIDGRDLFASCSIGIATSGPEPKAHGDLIDEAGVAMSHAKQSGGNGLQIYDESLNSQALARLTLENELRRALERDELALFYQPKVDVVSGRVVGAEALMRWTHPELGNVRPDQFIPIAEETGLIHELGSWALLEASRQTRRWRDAGFPPIRIAVNVSSHQIRSASLGEAIHRALESTDLDGSCLTLELTEGVIMKDPETTAEVLTLFKQIGMEISIDDFGTGYSSLSYLRRFPIDELKIDRSFVMSLDDGAAESDDGAIISAILSLAKSLGLKVVAEGVETEQQLQFLRERGCDVYQGYLCSPPLPASEWGPLLERL